MKPITAKSAPARSVIRRIVRPAAFVLLGLVLFVTGTVMALYSTVIQDILRERLVARMNAEPYTEFRLDKLSLSFPLRLELEGLLMVSHSDTLMCARTLDADMELFPLLEGKAVLCRANLTDARYQVGATDSASMVVIKAADMRLDRSTVRLKDMDIRVTTAKLDKGTVELYINPCDTFPDTPDTEQSPMTINVGHLDYTDLTFRMNLMPTIDTLETFIPSGSIDGINVNVLKQTVDVDEFTGKGMDVRYIMPDSAQIEACRVIVGPETDTAPWTVRVNKIRMDDCRALYTTNGVKPLPGLDFEYITATGVTLDVDSFYNCADVVRVPFRLKGEERCGVRPDISGTLNVDSVGVGFKDFIISTPQGTDIAFSGYMGTAQELTTPDVPLRLNLEGGLAVADAVMMFPGLKAVFAPLRKGADIDVDLTVGGRSGLLDVERLDLDVDNHITLRAHGTLANVFADSGLGGNITFSGHAMDVSHWAAALLADTGLRIPTLSLQGDVDFDTATNSYSGKVTAATADGKLALDGYFRGNTETYAVDMVADALPVGAFMPSTGVGLVTATFKATGHGLDFLSAETYADVQADVQSVTYMEEVYRNITLAARLEDGRADVTVDAPSPGIGTHLTAKGNLAGNDYDWTVNVGTQGMDLAALGITEEAGWLTSAMQLNARASKDLKTIDATLHLDDLDYTTELSGIQVTDAVVKFETTDSLTRLTIANGDLRGVYSSPIPLDSVLARVTKVQEVLAEQLKERKIDVEAVQRAIMPFKLNVEAGENNSLAYMLAKNDMAFERAVLEAGNDTVMGLNASVYDFRSGKVRLDTIRFDITQHGPRLDYAATVNNRPGTFDAWAHVDVNGYVYHDKISIALRQRNIRNQVGFDIGGNVTMEPDSVMTLRFDPLNPVINYTPWKVNKDNFITYDFRHMHMDADVRMKSETSSIALYTEHVNDTTAANHGSDEDLILQLFDLRIQDWIALNPFATPMKGNLSAGLRVNWEDHVLNGNGTVALTDFVYGKEKVGDFRADLDVSTALDGIINANAALWVNGQQTITLSGALNDSTATSPFNMDFRMIHFPLSTANAFLPGVAKLDGWLDGSMDIRGNADNPVMNGYLMFDNANVGITMLGSTLRLPRDTIPVKNSVVNFDGFAIKAANENPLVITGNVDLSSLATPEMNLFLKADNMQVVNTSRAPKGADVYGKAFINLDANALGNTDFLNVSARLDLLPGTNVTYIMADGATALESQANSGLVKFVNFNDTAAVAAADSLTVQGTILNMIANLNIQTGTIINVDLGANAQDRVQLQGSGQFNYVSSPVGDGRLTGRYTLSGGFFRYAPPLISNLNFNFTEGSYVAFTGNMLNPQVNVKAIEKMRANVSAAGQNSRLIYFDIILSATGTPDNLNVAFDLATDDDMTVANELATMSPTQRASEAMNLLLYNTYTGGSTKATSNLNGNPLFSFLTNSVNSWLANNVRGVDISLGLDQYDRTVGGNTSTTTSYSYQVSKSLFNDRFKIVVGGNYSDDASANENVAQNLISDISFEYFLNNPRTMYVRLFRHTGYVSILEGEITQTGVGFVYRKKINRVADIFMPPRWRRKHKQSNTK